MRTAFWLWPLAEFWLHHTEGTAQQEGTTIAGSYKWCVHAPEGAGFGCTLKAVVKSWHASTWIVGKEFNSISCIFFASNSCTGAALDFTEVIAEPCKRIDAYSELLGLVKPSKDILRSNQQQRKPISAANDSSLFPRVLRSVWHRAVHAAWHMGKQERHRRTLACD